MRGTCFLVQRCCCAFFNVFPKIICYGLYTWALYAFCFRLALNDIGGIKGIFVFIVGIFCNVLGMYSYYMTIKEGAGSPLDYPELKWKTENVGSSSAIDTSYDSDISAAMDESDMFLSLDDAKLADLVSKDLIEKPSPFYLQHTFTVKSTGSIRYCNKCKVWKPDRCHHCSTCKKCILKMDHHCPWFATCIGFKNHKYFIQFLTYTVIYSTVSFFITGAILYDFLFVDEHYKTTYISMNTFLLFIFGFTFMTAVGLFDAFSIYQVFTNRTTLESYDNHRYRIDFSSIVDPYYRYSNRPTSKDYGNLFDVGNLSANWKLVMGERWLEWILPIRNYSSTASDYYLARGICFPTNSKIYDDLMYNSRLQMSLANELNNLKNRRMQQRREFEENQQKHSSNTANVNNDSIV